MLEYRKQAIDKEDFLVKKKKKKIIDPARHTFLRC